MAVSDMLAEGCEQHSSAGGGVSVPPTSRFPEKHENRRRDGRTPRTALCFLWIAFVPVLTATPRSGLDTHDLVGRPASRGQPSRSGPAQCLESIAITTNTRERLCATRNSEEVGAVEDLGVVESAAISRRRRVGEEEFQLLHSISAVRGQIVDSTHGRIQYPHSAVDSTTCCRFRWEALRLKGGGGCLSVLEWYHTENQLNAALIRCPFSSLKLSFFHALCFCLMSPVFTVSSSYRKSFHANCLRKSHLCADRARLSADEAVAWRAGRQRRGARRR
eukprot:478777-Rhodomonas_salina.2